MRRLYTEGFRRVAQAALVVSFLLVSPGHSTAAHAATQLDADRPGARLSLRGPLTLQGTMPLSLDLLPPGNYRLRLQGTGLATSRGRLTRHELGQLSLASHTGPLALLVPPGVTHLNQGETGRGLLFAAAGAGMAAGVLLEEISRKEAAFDEGQAAEDYAAAISEEDFLGARGRYLEARERQHDSRELRNLWMAFLGVTWGGTALESWLLTPTPRLRSSGAGAYSLSTEGAGGTAAALRSLVAPGGGQRYLGHSGRGNFFLATVTLFGSSALVLDDAYLSARRSENATRRLIDITSNPQTAASLRLRLKQESDRTNSRNHLRWVCAGAAVGAYLWNIVDAVGLERTAAAPPSFGLLVEPQPDGMAAGLTWRLK